MVRLRFFLLIALIAAGLGVAHFGFDAFGGPSANDPESVTLLLFDISRSTSGIRDQYRAVVEKRILPVAKREGLLLGDIIDDNPQAHSETSLPVEQYFEKYSPAEHNKIDFDEEQSDRAAEALAEVEELLARDPSAPGSSILDALNLAERVYAAYPSANRHDLVIFSDMIEESDRYRFTAVNLRPQRIRTFIARERSEGLLPDLRAVEIYAVGAGITSGRDPKPGRIQAVRRFWLTYLSAAGATIPVHRYGPALIRYP